MSDVGRCYFFAGGGTGGHIYPAIGIAEQLKLIDPGCEIMFLASKRAVDAAILDESGYEYAKLDAVGFSARRALRFFWGLFKSVKVCKTILRPVADRAVVVSAGGFVSAPAVLAAKKLGVPVAMTNVDAVPGKANGLLGRYADQIFVQFEDTAKYFEKVGGEVVVSGCPLRGDFSGDGAADYLAELGLDANRKTLVVCGGSSGALTVNRAFDAVLERLEVFADSWQVVHVTGGNYEAPAWGTQQGSMKCVRLEYCHAMDRLLAGADVVVGRGGAVSVAEYAAAGVGVVCLPYPYHADQHQRKNVQPMVDAGAAVVVDDLPGEPEKTAEELLGHLRRIMGDEGLVEKMRDGARGQGRVDAGKLIAERICSMAGGE